MDGINSSEIYAEQNYNKNEEYCDGNSDSDMSDATLENCDVENESSEDNLANNSSSENLQNRIESLRNSMAILRNQLREERELWKKEVDEAIKMSNIVRSTDQIECTESTVDMDRSYDNPLKEFSIAEYEQKLIQYKKALAKAQAEKQASLKRHIAISNYKRKLLEVENMCNLELLRVKQNVQFLQPLQMMVSEWKMNGVSDGTESVEGDFLDKTEEQKLSVQVPIEMFTNKLYNDMNDMFSKLTPPPPINASMPHLAAATMQWQSDDFTAHSQSTVWYSGDCLHVSKF